METIRKLTKEESIRLFKVYKATGNREIRDQLVENYLYLPKLLVKKYAYRACDQEDIFQVACLGLLYAVERYDPDRGFEFDTFASPTIIGEIKKYYRDKQWVIRVPRRIQELNREIGRARCALEHQLMKTPTISEIAAYLKISEERVIEGMEGGLLYYPKSLSMEFESLSDGQEITLMDLIGEEDDRYENIGNADLIRERFEALNPLEKQIVEERYYQGRTQKEVAAMIGKSQMTVSRLEKKVLDKLKGKR